MAHFQAFRALAAAFPRVLFPLLADDTHLVGPLLSIGEAHSHLVDQLALLDLAVQPRQYGVWSPKPLPDSFVSLAGIPIREEGIQVLGVPLGSTQFIHSFLLEALRQDV
ncbi:unnamed protein product [Calypogeia fissa]